MNNKNGHVNCGEHNYDSLYDVMYDNIYYCNFCSKQINDYVGYHCITCDCKFCRQCANLMSAGKFVYSSEAKNRIRFINLITSKTPEEHNHMMLKYFKCKINHKCNICEAIIFDFGYKCVGCLNYICCIDCSSKLPLKENVEQKDNRSQIIINEHKHPIYFNYFDDEYICNMCKKLYVVRDLRSRFECSVSDCGYKCMKCDYNLCLDCVDYLNNKIA